MAYSRWADGDWYVFRESVSSKFAEDQAVAIAFDLYQQWRYTYGELKRDLSGVLAKIEKELRIGDCSGPELDRDEVMAIDRAMAQLTPAIDLFMKEVESESNGGVRCS